MEPSHKVKKQALRLFEGSAKDIELLQPTLYHRGVRCLKTKTTVSSMQSIQENDPEFSTFRLVPGTRSHKCQPKILEGSCWYRRPRHPISPWEATRPHGPNIWKLVPAHRENHLPSSGRWPNLGGPPTEVLWLAAIGPEGNAWFLALKIFCFFAQQIWSGNGLHIPPCKIKPTRYIGSRTELPIVFIQFQTRSQYHLWSSWDRNHLADVSQNKGYPSPRHKDPILPGASVGQGRSLKPQQATAATSSNSPPQDLCIVSCWWWRNDAHLRTFPGKWCLSLVRRMCCFQEEGTPQNPPRWNIILEVEECLAWPWVCHFWTD